MMRVLDALTEIAKPLQVLAKGLTMIPEDDKDGPLELAVGLQVIVGF